MAKATKSKLEDFLSKAKKRLKKCIDSDDFNRREAVDCLKMLNGEGYWNADDLKRRKLEGRPSLVVPLLPTFVNQVVGEMLHNRARAKVKPGDHKSSQQIAKIRSGIIADAEYRSNGEDIYMTAGKSQVACGYGAWRVNTRYTEENPFIQEVYLEAIPNPFMVHLDPTRKDEAGADAKYGFILTRMSRSEFKDEWPDAEFPGEVIKDGSGVKDELFFDKDHVTVAEYFVVKPTKVKMCLMEDGSVVTEEEAKQLLEDHKESVQELLGLTDPSPTDSPLVPMLPAAAGQPAQGAVAPISQQPGGPATPPAPLAPMAAALPPAKPRILDRREATVNKVKRYVITATEILGPKKSEMTDVEHQTKMLDGEDVPGCYIPIVLVLGITTNVEGKTYVKGLIKDARDAARLVCYWESALAEAIALAPKAPWMLTPRQVEGYEEDYRNANQSNLPYLLYNMDVDSGTAAPPPQRQRPSDPPVALFTQAGRAAENLKSVIGMHGADVGEVGPERTGAAVWAKQKPGDISTYVYAYKLNRAIEYSAKVMNAMIDEVYDTERDVRIRNIDDTETVVPVNTTIKDAVRKVGQNPETYKGLKHLELTKLYQQDSKAKFNDLTQGRYDVVVTVGPSYATARQESSAQLMTLVNSVPQIGKIAGDIIVEGIMDSAQGERVAARLRKTLPPGMVEPREGEKPYQPPPPPQVVLAIEKTKTEGIRQQKGMIEQKVALVKLYKEMTDTDKSIKDQIVLTLAELHANPGAHPADALMGEGPMDQQGGI